MFITAKGQNTDNVSKLDKIEVCNKRIRSVLCYCLIGVRQCSMKTGRESSLAAACCYCGLTVRNYSLIMNNTTEWRYLAKQNRLFHKSRHLMKVCCLQLVLHHFAPVQNLSHPFYTVFLKGYSVFSVCTAVTHSTLPTVILAHL